MVGHSVTGIGPTLKCRLPSLRYYHKLWMRGGSRKGKRGGEFFSRVNLLHSIILIN